MNICFVLPRYFRNPLGGYKIVYEYANRFANAGEHVYLLYLNRELPVRKPVPAGFMKLLVNRLSKRSPNWFPLSPKVTSLSGLDEDDVSFLTHMDAIIATAAETAVPVSRMKGNGKKYYFIQDYETFALPEQELIRTYQLGLIPVTVSRWLKERVDRYSETKAVVISNPVDTEVYRIQHKPEDRRNHTLGLLYHTSERKGLAYSFAAIDKLKDRYPDLTVKMFGTTELSDLPDFYEYTKSASREDTILIYNDVSVFICSTLWEGFGLTGLEAMACGAALCTTDFEGSREYAVHNKNALVSEPKDVKAMVSNVSSLFEDDQKRTRLAYQGAKEAKTHNWEAAVERFLAMLKNGTVE